MERDESQPESLGGSLFTLAATVIFVVYGGYLLLFSLCIGLPSEEPFLRFNSDIPALTMTVMDTPTLTWVIGYAFAAIFLCLQSARRVVGRLMTLFNLLIAASGLVILYAVYLAVAVLPGEKIMLVLDLL